jgi:hypothetical protein
MFKKIIVSILLSLATLSASPALWQAQNGVIYGNVCVIQYFAINQWGQQVPQQVTQFVNPQPVGTNCFAPMYNAWGYIANY